MNQLKPDQSDETGHVYDGVWSVVGDTICIELTFPSNDGCWSVALDGNDITLIGSDGVVDYERTIIACDGQAGG